MNQQNSKWVNVTKDEFERFIHHYPNKLERNVSGAYEPALLTINDFSDGKEWPESSIAYAMLYDGSEYHSFKETEYCLLAGYEIGSALGPNSPQALQKEREGKPQWERVLVERFRKGQLVPKRLGNVLVHKEARHGITFGSNVDVTKDLETGHLKIERIDDDGIIINFLGCYRKRKNGTKQKCKTVVRDVHLVANVKGGGYTGSGISIAGGRP